MPLRPIESVLFDLDGTLVNTGPLILHSFAEAVDEVLGLNLSPAEFLPGVGIPLRAQMERMAVAHLQGDLRMAFAQASQSSGPTAVGSTVHGIDAQAEDDAHSVEVEQLTDRLVGTYRTVNEQLHDSLIEPFSGVEQELQALFEDGMPMGIVTSKRDEPAWRDLAHFGLDRYFEVLVGADSVDRHKPDPFPLHVALGLLSEREGLGLSAARGVYIGDSPFDMLASKAAGTMTVAAAWGMFPEQTLTIHAPDYLLCVPRDLSLLRLSPAERVLVPPVSGCAEHRKAAR